MHRERRSRALYDLGKSLASALTSSHIIEISTHHLSGIFQSKLAILLPDSQEKIVNTSASTLPDSNLKEIDFGIVQWVYDHQQQAGFGTDTLPSSPILYIPLQAPLRTRGVLAIVPENKRTIFLPEQRQLLDTFASQIAIAIERVHYVEVAQDALVTMESERLRNTVLGAISHDLNTPLTTIVATSELLKQQTSADDPRYQYVTMLYEQSIRMKNLVVNLLDMARLQSGKVKLNKEWQMLEEVVGTALRAMKETLVAHQIIIDLPSDLPLLEFDAVLIDRVLCNLLDNVAKYAPDGGRICIGAEKKQKEVWVSVADDGPGLPENLIDQIFEKFTRGEKESTKAGVGLGLSICKAIIEAHDGKIWANNKHPHGAIFTFSLPLGIPPELPLTDEI
jgi:two-component system sensor histidine kinase KdpD